MNNKKKFQKIKDREREVRKKILRRREAIRQERKQEEAEQAEAAAREARFERDYDGGISKTIRNDPEKRDEAIKSRLQQNMKLLEALEQEYAKEQRERGERNADLEQDGFTSLQEKVAAFAKKVGGTAHVRVSPNETT